MENNERSNDEHEANLLDQFKKEVTRIAADPSSAHFRDVTLDPDALTENYATIWRDLKTGVMDINAFWAWENREKAKEQLTHLEKELIAWLGNVAQAEYNRQYNQQEARRLKDEQQK